MKKTLKPKASEAPASAAPVEEPKKVIHRLNCFVCGNQAKELQIPPMVRQMLGDLRIFYCPSQTCQHFGVLTLGVKAISPQPAPAAAPAKPEEPKPEPKKKKGKK